MSKSTPNFAKMTAARSASRRQFLLGSAALSCGYFLGAARRADAVAASERLNIAAVGVGGRGADDIHDLPADEVNIVALCDCDSRSAAGSIKKYPKAKVYTDWRKMLDAEKGIDAVVVATPDHNHAIISIAAMKLGKHVYCEKPLAHSIYEARKMSQTAAEMKVATQMGTQGHAYEGSRRAVEVIRSGAIGEVRELHVWTDRPFPPGTWWAQGIERPKETPPVPKGLDWDIWLGPARERPFSPAYVPFKWRGFWDFGTGAIGDMGIHNLDTAFWALELTVPTSVEVKDCSPGFGSPAMKETAPNWSIMELNFPARGDKPAVKMMWYDGGKLPPRALLQGEPMITHDGGSLVIGSKGTLFTRTWHGGENEKDMFVILPRKEFVDYKLPAPTLPRAPGNSHHHEWVNACRGGPMSLSNFGYASVLTESLLLGNVALRVGKKIEWDVVNMRATNCPEADQFIRPEFRKGWEV